MKIIFGILGLVVISFGPLANSNKNPQEEIQHLLSFVETSDCTYQRNGTNHSAIEAKAHIQKKYDYYEDKINSTEDFVKYSATKSKMSGKYYYIKCPGKTRLKSKDWLFAELENYRQRNHQ